MSRRRISIKTAISRSIPRGSRLLVGVSGGRDSMVLLDAVVRIRRLKALTVEVCHVDHRLREGSSRDAAFVAERCMEYGVECFVERLPAKPQRVNMEAWAREHRYRIFRRLLVDRRLDLFLTAHNANDVAETLMMRLLANKELNTIEEIDTDRSCLRPLLHISRAQIDEYVGRYGVPFVEDPTNSDTDLVRNRVRLNAIPFLEQQFDKSLVWILSEQAQRMANDLMALKSWAESQAVDLLPANFGDLQWRIRCKEVLRKLPDAVRWRAVEFLLEPAAGYPVGERLSSKVSAVLMGDGLEVRVNDQLVIKPENRLAQSRSRSDR